MVLFRGAVLASLILAYLQLKFLFVKEHVVSDISNRQLTFDEDLYFRNQVHKKDFKVLSSLENQLK
jgi:hypothetical protein